MAVNDRFGQVFDSLGISGMTKGTGFFGNLFLWIFIVLIVFGCIGFGFWWWYSKKIHNQEMVVFGMMGNQPMEKWKDNAKFIRLGIAGDRLLFPKKLKRHLPLPTIQGGINKWYYWQREDGELINIGFPNVDLIQKKMGIKFIDTDMRMERLGIAKMLQFRHQKEGFWDKYGNLIMNTIAYVMMALMMIILFMEWRKTGTVLEGIASKVSAGYEKCGGTGTHKPTTTDSGVIPAIILLIQIKYNLFKSKHNHPSLSRGCK